MTNFTHQEEMMIKYFADAKTVELRKRAKKN